MRDPARPYHENTLVRVIARFGTYQLFSVHLGINAGALQQAVEL